MFLSSCRLNPENILALLRKTNLEIFFAATTVVLFLTIARNFGRLFFSSYTYLELLLSINLNISRSEIALITVNP